MHAVYVDLSYQLVQLLVMHAPVDPNADKPMQIDWAQFGAVITAAGGLGMAAFGVVEALGKALTFSFTRGGEAVRFGLPYVGFGAVKRMIRPLKSALAMAYGDGYMEIIAQQYRADRSKGRAPDTIQAGVKLGLPFLSQDDAAKVISGLWNLGDARSKALAAALDADQPAAAAPDAALLAGRFATALNERVSAAFDFAEERYEAAAKLLAALSAVVLACGFNWLEKPRFDWWAVIFIGLVAVPLAPVAKDLSTSLQNALTAFKSLPAKRA
jgi:hypothetical protein